MIDPCKFYKSFNVSAYLHLYRIVIGLFAILLLVAQNAWAQQPAWSGVSVSPASGTVDAATGKLSVRVTGSVISSATGGTVTSVVLYYDNQTYQSQDFPVVMNSDGETPVNSRRDFNFSVPVAAGSHPIQLYAGTSNGEGGYTAVYTVNAAANVQTNQATFRSQNVPSNMVAGQTYNVSVTMRNTGTRTWVPGGAKPHGLGSQSPQDNAVWRANRVPLTASVAPGADATFNFTVTAPSASGNYPFQWRMVHEYEEWFGDFSPSVQVSVNVPPTPVPTITLTPSSTLTLTSGQGTTVNWSTSNATAVSRSCVASGTGYSGTISLSPSGSRTETGRDVWVGYPSTCTWTASGAGGNVSVTQTMSTRAAPTAAPTISVSPSSFALTVGQNASTNWSTTNATTVSRSCVASGSGYNGTVSLATSGSRTETGNASWVGLPSTCTWTATGTGGTASATQTMTTAAAASPAPTISVSPGSLALTVGQTASTNWSTTNATSVSRSCVASGSGYNGTVSLATSGSRTETGNASWVGSPSTCTWTATGAGGSATFTQTIATSAAQASAQCLASTPASGTYTGDTSGSAWGNNRTGYTTDSNVGRAAAHAGLLAVGQTGNLVITPMGELSSFTGSTENGVTTNSYGSPWCAMQLSRATAGSVAPTVTLQAPLNLSNFVAGSGGTAPVAIQGVASGTTISKIELLDGSTVIDTVLNSTNYNKVFNLSRGTHALSLKAFSAANVSTSSAIANVTVHEQISGDSAVASAITVPSAMRAGQPYSVSVTMVNNGTTTWSEAGRYRLGAQNPQDNRIWGGRAYLADNVRVAPGATTTFNFMVTAPKDSRTFNFQWQMVQENVKWFGAKTANVPIVVSTGPGPTATLSASPRNVRVSGTQTQNISFTGTGNSTGGQLTRLELLQDSGRGYSDIPVATSTGNSASLALSKSLDLPAGVYAFRLRATDGANVRTDSDPVSINITNSALLGTTSGVRSNAAGNPELFGWVCQPGSAAALSYQILIYAPTPDAGGVVLAEGTANVTTESDNSAVTARCGSGGHHFVLDLSTYVANFAGHSMYVFARTANAEATASLPCADNSCTIPGGLRVGLTTPVANATFSLPQPAFLKMKLSNYSGTFDEVGFMVDDTWVPAAADGAPGEYSAQKYGLAARTAPYMVHARVRQGGTTVRSLEVPFYMAGGAGVALTAPAANESVTLGMRQPLAASSTGTNITAVRFFANGSQIASGSSNGGVWNASWAPATVGTYSIEARAFSADGAQVAISGPVTTTVVQGSSDRDPIPVKIDLPHVNNAIAGTLPGEITVGSTGTAAYAIALVVPPGSANLAPELSLNYSSDSTNGLYGLGWSMQGISSIHRCGKTIAQDGENGRVSFDNGDRLCLDGQRLVLANLTLSDANYWAEGAEYRTEIDVFSRVTKVFANGRTSFKIESKDGRIATYGSTADSNISAIVKPISGGVGALQPQAKTGAMAWSLDGVKDRAGNYIGYAYEQNGDTGESRPTFIRYGGAGKSAHAAVAFSYESRPDAWKRYVDEARNDLRSRTTHIRTYVGANLNGDVTASGTLVRDYTLTYEQSPTSGRSLIKQIEVAARNPQTGAMESLPATEFSWGKPDPGKTPGFVSRGIWPNAPVMTTHGANSATNHDDYFAFADFENHGLTDVLEKRIASPQQPYSPEAEAWVAANPIRPGTMAAQYAYYHNNGAGFTKYQYGLNTGENFAVLDIGDFDGDGSPDLLASTANGPKICISPLGAGAPTSVAVKIIFTCASAAARPAIGANDVYGIPYVVDVDGDGRAALYSRISSNSSSADLYVQNQKLVDNNPPYDVLAYEYQMYGMPSMPTEAYVGINQMIDVAGSGKPQDVRWTQPYFIMDQTDSDGTVVRLSYWTNLAPTVIVTGFRRPGTTAMPVASYFYPEYEMPGSGRAFGYGPYKFDSPHPGGMIGADFNGTGYTGAAFGFVEQTTHPVTQRIYATRAELTLCLSTGRALDCHIRKKYSGDNYVAVRSVGDFVGDGHPQLLVEKTTNGAEHLPVPTGELQLCRVMGDATADSSADSNIVCTPWGGVKIPQPVMQTQSGDKLFFLDLLGTGRTQLVYYHAGKMDANRVWTGDDRWEVFEPRDVAVDGQALDLLYQVKNGVGAQSTLTYADGIQGGAVTRSSNPSLAYPQRTVTPVGKFVTRLTTSNGVSANRSVSYQYEDSAIDLSGRGALGFAKVTATDEQTGIITTSTYGQVWPYTGLPLSVKMSTSTCTLSDLQNRMTVKQIVQKNGAVTRFPFVAGSVQKRKDLTCSDLETTTVAGDGVADVEYDKWGNLIKSTSTVNDARAQPGASVTTATNHTYFDANEANWQVGLVKSTVVKKTQNVGNTSTSVTRTTEFTYEEDFSGRLKTVTVEPKNNALKSVTTYDRNAFGLVNQKTLTWTDATLGAQSRVETMDYDANGRFLVTQSNALSQQQTATYSPATGAITSRTDENKLATTWQVDGFGRVLVELRPDGNETRTYRKQCDAECPTGAVVATVTEFFNGANRIAVPQISYADHAGHLLQTLTWGFDGRKIHTEQSYDTFGRPDKSYRPRYAGETATLAKHLSYDMLGRVTSEVTKDESGANQTATITYAGLTTTYTNANRQSRTVLRDALGRVESITDALGNKTSFSYDPFDNLKKTIDPSGNVVNVIYDDLGRKVELNDPNMGRITYAIDPIGQILSSVNPVQRSKSQQTVFTYDALGRMTDRVEPSLKSHWSFDTATNGIGKLAEAYTGTAAQKDYRRVHTYDAKGRPLAATQYIRGAQYTSLPTYDAWGRVINQRSQRVGENGAVTTKDFRLVHNKYGYLERVLRGSLTLWQIETLDAEQLVTSAKLGNGLLLSRSYNAYTGRLSGSLLKTGAQAIRQQDGYQYDSLGNVLNRTLAWDSANFIETFTYDALNRIKTSQVAGFGEQSYSYDNVGNLSKKTGVGDYEYGPQGAGIKQPHAVKSVGGSSYSYDDNGNLLSGGGRTMSWTSFDMPDVITKGGGQSSTFVYGPEYQRVVQTRQDGSTTVYAGTQEVETSGGATVIRTYWPLGLGMEVDKAGSVELNWVHKDRLGSITAITGENGELKERLSYDTWGKRRTLNGSSTPDNLDGQLDNKGYTGHEMLDALDLVHMNGRVYDPLLARFASPDPLVQDPFNGQSYNRYSYVLNNPTKLIDPTGFASVDSNSGITTIVIPGNSGSSGDVLSVISNSSGASRELNRATPRVNPKSGGVTNKTDKALKFVWSTAKRAALVAFLVVTSGNEFQKNTEDEEVAAMHARAAAENALRKDGEGEASGEDAGGTNSGDGKTAPSLPDKIVGDQSDPRAGPNKGGGKHTSGPLTPENGGVGDFEADLNTLTGGYRPRQPGDKAPPGSLVGPNGIFGRPENSGGGKSIDIPGNGNKPHETLHYP
ncbi:MAG: RHS repeat-associated core domain-containing protein [Duganella sp.]